MTLILFIGIPATGKSSFFRERFFRSHVRINLDMLKTRHREQLLVEACLAGKTAFVVDNTNLTGSERERYIAPARAAGFRVVGYFFESRVADAGRRNAQRDERDRVPDKAILGCSGRLELPNYDEGFDELFFVRLVDGGSFVVEDWKP